MKQEIQNIQKKIYNLAKTELKKIVEIVGEEIDNTITEN